jgi:hypothetical protein
MDAAAVRRRILKSYESVDLKSILSFRADGLAVAICCSGCEPLGGVMLCRTEIQRRPPKARGSDGAWQMM